MVFSSPAVTSCKKSIIFLTDRGVLSKVRGIGWEKVGFAASHRVGRRFDSPAERYGDHRECFKGLRF